ncbi:MAG: SgcJ/EcaC family oxidoreductase [Chryseolinea sp.]
MATLVTNASDVQEDIKSANQQFEKRFASGDATGMASLYTQEALLMPPGAPVQQGRNAIGAFWKMVMEMGIKNARLTTKHIDELGETAVEVGEYELGGQDGQSIDRGKYIVVWKKEKGDWRLDKDIWNTSVSQN